MKGGMKGKMNDISKIYIGITSYHIMDLSPKFYWVGCRDGWCIGGQSGHDNSIVEVTRKDGSTQSVAIGANLGKKTVRPYIE